MMKKCLVLLVLLLCVVHCAPVAEEVVLPTATAPGGEGVGRVQRDEPFPTFTPQPTQKPTRLSTAVPPTEPTTTPSPTARSPYTSRGAISMEGAEMLQERKKEGDTLTKAVESVLGKPKPSFVFMDGGEEVWALPSSGSAYGSATTNISWCSTYIIGDDSIITQRDICSLLSESVDFDNDGFAEVFLEDTEFTITFIDKKEEGGYEFSKLRHPLSLKFESLTSVEMEGEQYIITADERASYDTSKLFSSTGLTHIFQYESGLFRLSWLDHNDAPENSAVILNDDYETETRSKRFVIDQTTEQPRLLLDELNPVQIFFRTSACRDSFVGIVEPGQVVEYWFKPQYERHLQLNLGVVTDGKHIVHSVSERESAVLLEAADVPAEALTNTEGLEASYALERYGNYVIRVSTEAESAVQYTLHVHFC